LLWSAEGARGRGGEGAKNQVAFPSPALARLCRRRAKPFPLARSPPRPLAPSWLYQRRGWSRAPTGGQPTPARWSGFLNGEIDAHVDPSRDATGVPSLQPDAAGVTWA